MECDCGGSIKYREDDAMYVCDSCDFTLSPYDYETVERYFTFPMNLGKTCTLSAIKGPRPRRFLAYVRDVRNRARPTYASESVPEASFQDVQEKIADAFLAIARLPFRHELLEEAQNHLRDAQADIFVCERATGPT
jgi:hypothetical protein